MSGNRSAPAPGKCGCCLTPYAIGAVLRQEFGKWVLVDHAPSLAAAKTKNA